VTRQLSSILLFVVVPLLVFPTARGEPTAAKTFHVKGVVVDADGKPVAGAAVRAKFNTDSASATSGADGRFDLELPSKTKFRAANLHASHDGDALQAWGRFAGSQEKDKPDPEVRLVLRRAREFPVTVSDAGGKPVGGARVRMIAEYAPAGEATTDAAGRATLRMPADAAPQYVLASKPDAGLDYMLFWPKERPLRTDPYRLPPDHAGPLAFVLRGMTPVTVRATDDAGVPLKGVEVHPWYYEMEKKGAKVVLPSIDELKGTTDERGQATFEIPSNNTKTITFWTTLDGYCVPERCVWDPASKSAEAKVTLVRMTRVSGRVVDESGKPAGGATVRVAGAGRQFDDFDEDVQTRADGTFELDVDPDMFYLFVATGERTASPPVTRMIRKGAAIEPIELTLAAATRVFGRLTAGDAKSPAAEAYLSISLQDSESYYALPDDQKFPGPRVGVKAIIPSVSWSARSGGDGSFEFFVGPGTYYLRGSQPDASGTEAIKIAPGQPEREANLHAEQAAPVVLAGTVVLRDEPTRTVPEVNVDGRHTGHGNMMRIEATSDARGQFSLRKGNSELYLYGVSADKRLRGIVVVPAGGKDATLPVGPTATARGRLVDSAGAPLPGQTVEYGVRVDQERGTFSFNFGGEAKTGDDGAFSLDGLVPGFTYELNVATDFDDKGHPNASQRVGKASPEDTKPIDLGDLKAPAVAKKNDGL
jgi:protocatechuate 3,4-dioxygenase beta subunit